MITKYTEIATMRLVVIVVLVMPLFLMYSSILTPAKATTDDTAAISDIVSDVSSIQIAPVLLAPMATSGSNVYVVWPSNATGHLEILFRASGDNGQTFADKVNLSNTPNVDSIDPEIVTSSGDHVYVSWWEDFGNGTRVPFFKASNDNGQTFGSVLSLSDDGPIPVQN